jgi:hypothetical protein
MTVFSNPVQNVNCAQPEIGSRRLEINDGTPQQKFCDAQQYQQNYTPRP